MRGGRPRRPQRRRVGDGEKREKEDGTRESRAHGENGDHQGLKKHKHRYFDPLPPHHHPQVHVDGVDHATQPTPVLNGASTVAAWTRLLVRRPDEGVELSVHLTRAGWARALWPAPVAVCLGRAVLAADELAPPDDLDGRGRGPWRCVALQLAKDGASAAELSRRRPAGTAGGDDGAAARARAEGRASSFKSGDGGVSAVPPPSTPTNDDATDIALPRLDTVLHGSRGVVLVEWRVGIPPAAPPPWYQEEVPIARLRRAAHAYAHGGFMGLAPSMMADPAWVAILEAEDPPSAARVAPVAAAARAAVAAAAAGVPDTATRTLRLMTMLENSPVLCAYGMVRCGSTAPLAGADGGGGVRGRGTRAASDRGGTSLDGTPSRGETPCVPAFLDGGGGGRGAWLGFAGTPPPEGGSASPPRVVGWPPDRDRASPPPPAMALRLPPTALGDRSSPPPPPPARASPPPASPDARTLSSSPDARPCVVSRSPSPPPPQGEPPPTRRPPRVPPHRRTMSDAALFPAMRSPFASSDGAPPPRPLSRHATFSTLLARPESDASLASADESGGGRTFFERGGGSAAALVRVLSEALFSDSREPGTARGTGPRTPLAPRGADAGGASSSSSSGDDEGDDDDDGSGTTRRRLHRRDSSGDDDAAGPWPSSAAPVRSRLADHEASGLAALRAAALACTPPAVLADRPGGANRYGYSAPALEWDVWIDPAAPWDLGGASVDHGTPGALVAQAITAGLPGLSSLARAAGAARILRDGISPAAWLTLFGRSVNAAVCGDPRTPLPLALAEGASPGFAYRLNVRVSAGRGSLFGATRLTPRAAARVYLRLSVRGSTPLPRLRGPPGSARGAGAADGERVAWLGPAFSLWPLPPPLSGAVLRIEVRSAGGAGGRLRDRRLGTAEVPLSAALAPRNGVGPPASTWVPLEPRRHHRKGGEPADPPPPASVAESADSETAITGSEADGGCLRRRRRWSVTPAPDDGDVDESDADAPLRGRTPADPPASTDAALWGEVRVWLSLEEVAHLDAAAEAGVERAAAQTCLALLSRPGGIFLDVKSAYSTAADVQLFAGALAGLGIHVKAVLSFARRQLDDGGLARAARTAPGVRLFHGLSGLELACERGHVPRGSLVLFNGASLVLPHAAGSRGARAAADDPALRASAAGGGGLAPGAGGLLDPVAVRRYVALVELHGFAGGVYLQEADACAAAVDTLTRAVAEAGPLLPLGFAYGGVAGAAPAALGAAGRGYGGQDVVDELGARRALSRRAARRVARGDAAGASLTTAIALAHRLLRGAPILCRAHQRLLLRLMWDVWPPDRLVALVSALGGVPAIFHRFWSHYEATSPLTLLELGFNANHTKDLARLLRDRGVLASLPRSDKVALATWLASPELYGWGLTYMLMARGVRAGRHKFVKEALACLLESCDGDDAAAVVAALGGRRALMRALRGNVPLSQSYASRVCAVEAVHAADPSARAVDGGAAPRYARLPHRALPPWHPDAAGADPCHTRHKIAGVKVARIGRKVVVLAASLAREAALALATGGLWPALVTLPRAAAPHFSSALGTSVAVSLVVLTVVAAVLMAGHRWGGVWVV